MMKLFLTLILIIAVVNSEVYFEDNFSSDDTSSWVASKWNGDKMGSVGLSSYNYRSSDSDKGLKTLDDARFYTNTAKFSKTFDNKDKTLVLQFSVQHPDKFDCGGAYLKYYGDGEDLSAVKGGADGKPETKYNIMFGPDICGTGTSKVHVIFNYNGKNVEKTEEVKLEYGDKTSITHLYTLIVKSDNTYEVKIDNESKAKGSLKTDFPLLEPKQIDDPTDSKPSDWVDEEMMNDPTDVKPEGYDDIKEKIVDPTASQPDDWDEEMDGKWEAPMINNPDFKGPWSAKQIKNPGYKGVWAPKKIDNPDFKDDDSLYHYVTGAVGIEDWQVNAGTIFDNILVTDDVDYASEAATKALEEQDDEKSAKEEADKIKAAEEAKKAEAMKAAEAAKQGGPPQGQMPPQGQPPVEEEEDDDDDDEDDEKPSEKAGEL